MKKKLESLNSAKFKQLSYDELKNVKGAIDQQSDRCPDSKTTSMTYVGAPYGDTVTQTDTGGDCMWA
ncbi:hypothetical protein [Pedobacter sp. KACC 23697]|uniref:Bacteriocin n=1 Tax=Pedobacter sp. KACC 23697 TaxID=3149230 RepID=A0AAU7K5S5_9SPHI